MRHAFFILLISAGQMFGQAGTFIDLNTAKPSAPGIVVGVPVPGITASFTFSPGGGSWPLGVQFTDTTQGGPSSWSWNFGDGTTSTLQNPFHTFGAPAQTFTISLTATGPGGMGSVSHTLTTTNATTIDIPLLAGMKPAGGYHISSNGRWNVFITQVVGAPNNDAQAFVYTDSGQTNYLTLTNLLGMAALTIDQTLKSNTLVVCGPSGSGGTGKAIEYELGNESPLPLTISATTTQSIGSGFTSGNCTLLSNGGIAAMLTQSSGYSNQAYAVSYRRPSGVWTNEGVIIVETNDVIGSTAFPTDFASAEMPGDNTLWTFQTRDSAGWILAGVWTFDANGLSVSKGFRLVDNHIVNGTNFWYLQSPYGEFPRPAAIADKSTNRLLLTYFSDFGYSGAPSVRVGNEVVTAITADTNHYLFQVSTNTTHRQSRGTLCWSSAVVTFGYDFCTSSNPEPLNNQPLPYQLQSIPNGQPSLAPTSPFLDYGGNYVLFRSDAKDFVVLPGPSTTTPWHLIRL